jgi:DNA polymerase III epsilon subunit-like protein
VELCYIKLYPDGSEESKTMRIKPADSLGNTIHVPEYTSNIHGIYDDDVKDCPTFKSISKTISKLIEGSDIGGFNSNRFDIPLLAEEFLRCDNPIDLRKCRFVDVQTIFHKMEKRTLEAAYSFYCNKELVNAHSALADAKATYEVTKAVKAVTKKPVYMKLSPNVTDITEIARACEAAGADGISLINTLMGMRIDLRRKAPIIKNKTGGLSGPAIFPVAVRMVYQVYEAVKIPLIGMGGVQSAEDVIELMLAGATGVEVGAANLVSPTICRDIINDLPAVMEKYNITNLKDIIGGAH